MESSRFEMFFFPRGFDSFAVKFGVFVCEFCGGSLVSAGQCCEFLAVPPRVFASLPLKYFHRCKNKASLAGRRSANTRYLSCLKGLAGGVSFHLDTSDIMQTNTEPQTGETA